MPRIARTISLLALLVVAAPGCDLLPTRPHEGFCCLSTLSCTEAGEAVGEDTPPVTPCTDPATPYCTDNVSSALGDRWSCVPDPLGQACTEPSECPEERPLCIEQWCVQCASGADCGDASPFCFEDTGLCGPCTLDDDCSDRPDAPWCLEATGGCVGCRDVTDCGSATAPVCDEGTHACRGCADDSECASDVCDRNSGECVAEANVIYLDPTGVTSGNCPRAEPCATFAYGLTQVTGSRNVIKAVPGDYSGQIVISGDAVRILAAGATIAPASTNQSVVVIDNGANVSIDGLTIQGAGGTGNPVGVVCSPGAGSPPTFALRGAVVTGNVGGGVSITSCATTLVNNMIVRNGGPSASIGGVKLDSVSSLMFDFNTVADNATTSESFAAGVQCSAISGVMLTNSIVYGSAANQWSATNCEFR